MGLHSAARWPVDFYLPLLRPAGLLISLTSRMVRLVERSSTRSVSTSISEPCCTPLNRFDAHTVTLWVMPSSASVKKIHEVGSHTAHIP